MLRTEQSFVEPADRDLERRVVSFLISRRVPSVRLLEVEARGGTVVLRGRVRSFYEKQLSQQCCRRVAGVIELIDQVEVAPAAVSRPSKTALLALLAVATTLLVAGCSKADPNHRPLFPVKGQVEFEGQALPGALVVFHPTGGGDPKAVAACGVADQGGQFALTTYKANDGAAAGEYTVTVELRGLIGSGDDAQAGPNLLPPRYSSPKTSDVRLRVAEGRNDLGPIQLRR